MFSIIVAKSINNIIGINNSLPWNLPSDLKRFKEITMGKKILMGRKTFESLPFILPGRTHLVLTTNKDFSYKNENVIIYNNLESLIKEFKDSEEEIFVIGGGGIFSQFINLSFKLYITEVLKEIDGDTHFPKIDYSKWVKTYESKIYEENNIKFKFINYLSKKIEFTIP